MRLGGDLLDHQRGSGASGRDEFGGIHDDPEDRGCDRVADQDPYRSDQSPGVLDDRGYGIGCLGDADDRVVLLLCSAAIGGAGGAAPLVGGKPPEDRMDAGGTSCSCASLRTRRGVS